MSRAALIVVAALLGACRPAADATPGAPPADPANPLEIAARDAHLVVDPATTPPTGLFERSHAAGRDGLCLTAIAGSARAYRFGLTASYGSRLVCEGQGDAVHDGATLHLSFDRADCAIDAAYDGNRVQMPGQVAAGCAALCSERGSLSGVAVTRTGWSQAEARALYSRRDVIAGREARRLCP